MRQFSHPPLRLVGATVLRDGQMQKRSVALQHGVITKGPLPEVDLSGYLVLPGIIDLHGDAFERHIVPRPSAPFPIETGIYGTDRDAAANGVTTAWLAQSWSWEGGHRGPDAAEDIMKTLTALRPHLMTDLRLQLRVETHTVDTADRLLAAVRRYGIDYVIFNNHLDEGLQLAQSRPVELALWAAKSGRTPQAQLSLIEATRTQSSQVPRYLCRLAEAFDTLGLHYGSHDDPDGETRERFSMIGARICEFPTARSAAALARAVNNPVVMGAPNVVRGGSQSGNIAAVDLIRGGLCDALVSDYYYPALAQAAFRLVDDSILDLPAAWAMISSRPAEILHMADRGVIAQGKRADLCVVNAQTRRIEATLVAGRLTYLTGEAAHRFLGSRAELSMAAE